MCLKTVLLPLIFACGWVLSGCGESPTTSTPSTPTFTQSTSMSPPPSALSEPATVRATWPFVGGEGSPVTLAENLTVRNYFMIFDGSGSMMGNECAGRGAANKMDAAKQAVVEWSKGVPADANLGLFAFHAGGFTKMPLSGGRREPFIEAILGLAAGGRTPLAEAAAYAYEACTQQARRQLGYGEYTIVVVTDGIADSIIRLNQEVERILSETPITLYSIGFCIGRDHSLNQPGRTLYKSADNPEQLRQGLLEVLAESEVFDDREFLRN
jgi:Ca-activated chloride channel homolog